MLACPAQTDCQGYVGLIANGEYREALKLIKDKVPLPASIGRVCPHPCEEACRRTLVEEPISIAALKAFVGDMDLQGEAYTPEIAPDTGKQVAVIGGGPGGLTAAYFLRARGHAVTVYDAMPKMGGMLRYGIPEYRLPKALLQAEIDAIAGMGVEMRNNVRIGRDITLEALRETYDAVIVAVGAWTSMGLRCPGEDLAGVVGGIDFLRDIAESDFAGRKIAVVGGGNTAMDACRTAVRLGASAVYNIYRRTKNEMPAEATEIAEAEEEGVVFKNLTNPIEVVGEGGRVAAVRLQVMELGAPDASGRRSPVPVPGREETIAIDTMIVAIGQKTDAMGLEALDRTRWGTIVADERTFLTNLPGVFAVGDATNDGADIAITAIGEAKRAAEMVCKYLGGGQLHYEPEYYVKSEKSKDDFADTEKYARVKMPHRCPEERRKDFLEVNLGLGEEGARGEAMRCLECGCGDYFECKLIEYANQYQARPEKYDGKAHKRAREDGHPLIHRNPDKCILCGLCVRVCDEAVGAAAIGLVNRGFDTIVQPALNDDLRGSGCAACGQCAAVCPTGALTEAMMLPKPVPLREDFTGTVCPFCSVGCGTRLASKGSLLTRSLPAEGGLLCRKGRFGFGELAKQPRLTVPLARGEEAPFEQAIAYANENLRGLPAAVAISDRYTNEEAFLIKEYAEKALGARVYSFGRTESGLEDVLGRDASTAAFDELGSAELIAVLAPGIAENHGVVSMRIQRAERRGAKVLGLEPRGLRGVLKALAEAGRGREIGGCDAFCSSLEDVKVGEEAREVATALLEARRAVFVFAKNAVTTQAARCVANMAALSGHGVLQLLPGANSQGLSDLGVGTGEALARAIEAGEVRGLFIFGEDPQGVDLGRLDFLAVQELHRTRTVDRADVVFPASSFAEVSGTFTGADGRVRALQPAVPCPAALDNAAQARALAAQAGVTLGDAELPRVGEISVRLAPIAQAEMLRDSYHDTNALGASFMAYTDQVL